MHGGDVYRNQVHMDFSVNVNPLGFPRSVKKAMEQGILEAQCYPDAMCEKLRAGLSLKFGIPSDQILCGNGASELIMAICRWKMPRTAILLGPAFLGYQRALDAVGCAKEYFLLRKEEGFAFTKERAEFLCKELEEKKPDLLFVTTPSNPTGRLVPKEILIMLARQCERTRTNLVLDECFMELTEKPKDSSMASEPLDFSSLLILRAFTKSFSVPGIRLGYLLCGDKAVAEGIAAQLPEWNVSVVAEKVGIAALSEEAWLMKAREVIMREREFLTTGLGNLGAKVFPSDANFLLFSWKDDALYEKLLEKGILIRDCRDFEGLSTGYYRVAIRTHEGNEALLRVMREL